MHPVLAVVLALASAGCYALSAALQHREASAQTASGAALVGALMRRRAWWAAQGATILGALLHLCALGAGPLVLVQPLGVTALVLALPVGAKFGRVRVTRKAWAGAACVVIGLPAVLAAVPHHPGVGRAVAPFPLAALVVATLVGLAVLGARLARRRTRLAAVLLAGGAALCFGLTSGAVKALWMGADRWPLVVLVGLVAVPVGVLLAQHAYRDGGLGAPLAVQTIADPVTAMSIGVFVLGEPLATSPLRLALGLTGVAVTVLGVALLSTRRAATAPALDPRTAVAAPAAP